MNRRSILSLSTMTAVGLVLLPGSAVSQQKALKDQLLGTWIFVDSTGKRPDGSLLGPAMPSTARPWSCWNVMTAPRVIWFGSPGFHNATSSCGV